MKKQQIVRVFEVLRYRALCAFMERPGVKERHLKEGVCV